MFTNLADHILACALPQAKPEWIAKVLSQLIWLTADNGDEICDTMDVWLLQDDKRKVEIVLNVDGIFPFGGGPKMIENLQRVENRWPELAGRCDEIIQAWRKQHERQGE